MREKMLISNISRRPSWFQSIVILPNIQIFAVFSMFLFAFIKKIDFFECKKFPHVNVEMSFFHFFICCTYIRHTPQSNSGFPSTFICTSCMLTWYIYMRAIERERERKKKSRRKREKFHRQPRSKIKKNGNYDGAHENALITYYRLC